MKKNIAIVMGGYSSEVHISIKSGNVVYQNISKAHYNSYRVHILEDKWVALDAADKEYPINKQDFSFQMNGEHIHFDAVFNAIHGTPGEDGKLIAYFELIGLKHSSAPFYQMALTFNKRDSLSVVKNAGIKTAKSVYLNQGDTIHPGEIISTVGLPCFVKPNNSGSSFGISKVKSLDELLPAINKAYTEDSEILIESFLDGTEISVGVIEYQGKITVLPMTEIVTENDFFDYEAKYLGQSEEITPARISDELRTKVATVAKKAYRVLNMKGISRSEYIIVNNEPYFLEMNTVPGLTAESIVPQQAAAAGISLPQLFHDIIETTLNNEL